MLIFGWDVGFFACMCLLYISYLLTQNNHANDGKTDDSGEPDQGNPSQATNSYWGKALGDAVRNGSISMDRLDDMVRVAFFSFFLSVCLFSGV